MLGAMVLTLLGGLWLLTLHPRPAAAPRRPAVQAADTTPSGDLAFEDKLKQFLSSSERKMADLNRNISGKQGGRRRK